MRYIEYSEEGLDAGRRRLTLSSLGSLCMDQVRRSVEWRRQLGVADRWAEDLAFYEGREDAVVEGREVSSKAEWEGLRAPRVGDDNRGGVKSRVFLNVIKPYTDNAAARVMDFIAPGDDLSWDIKPTPVPDLPELAGEQVPTYVDEAIEAHVSSGPGLTEEERGEAAGAARERLVTEAKLHMRRADQAAERAKAAIWDWLVESRYDQELRKCADDMCQSGTGVMKGPVPVPGGASLRLSDGGLRVSGGLRPMSMRVDYANCFPDPAGGENPHEGEHHWERDHITAHRLRELARDPTYFTDEVVACLKEGPLELSEVGSDELDLRHPDAEGRKRLFELWVGYCFLDAEDLRSIGARLRDTDGDADGEGSDGDGLDELDELAVRVAMVNGRVVQIVPNHHEGGAFPYDYMVWSPRAGMPWGDGVPRLGRDAQRIIVGASRMMMNNAGIASGPMIVLDMNKLVPEDGKWEFRSLKVWKTRGDIDDVRGAFATIDVDMGARDLREIVHLGMKFMEDVTGQPVLLQGQSGEHTPDTVGGMKLLNDNSSAPMRRVARLVDDRFIEPHIVRYYDYLRQHGDGRGGDYSALDMQVHAKGSAALVQRDAETQNIIGLLQLALNPAYGLDPRKVMMSVIRGLHLSSKDYAFDDARWKEVVEMMAQPPRDTALDVAQVRAEVERLKLESNIVLKREGMQVELLIEQMRRRSGDMATRVKAMRDEMEAMADKSKLDTDQRKFFEGLFTNLQTSIADREQDFSKFLLEQQTKLRLKAMEVEAKRPEGAKPGGAGADG